MPVRTGTKRSRDGHAVVEIAFLLPWVFFLFAGALDMGFYSHALIATTNAARAAALSGASASAAAGANSAQACAYAIAELRGMPNVRGLASCDAAPLIVTATAVTGADGAGATEVRVVYTTPRMIPIPGLPGQLTITRTAQVRFEDI